MTLQKSARDTIEPNEEKKHLKLEKKRICLKNFGTQIEQFPQKSKPDLILTEQYLFQCTLAEYPSDNASFADLTLEPDKAKPQIDSFAVFCSKCKECKYYGLQCVQPLWLTLDRRQYAAKMYTKRIKCADLLDSDERVLIMPQRLKNCRSHAGFSLEQVSELSWVSNVWLHRQEQSDSTKGTGKKEIEKALCYYLAALYGTTPGYLMGQTDNPNKDIFITKYIWHNLIETAKPSKPMRQYVIEEVIVSPIYYPSKKQQRGLAAGEELKNLLNNKYAQQDFNSLLQFLNYGENIYFTLLPKDVRDYLSAFLTGITESSPYEVVQEKLKKLSGQNDEPAF